MKFSSSYLGRSTGPGSLALWTHHLKDIKLFDYHTPFYRGKAMKIGAGVQAFEAYEAADKLDSSIVGGECLTVGLAGGYTQGGGHSALSSKHGLAADQTLEFEVISGSGELIRASPLENPDLYWALSGGGGGTYGVVYSMTLKVHPNVLITGVKLGFTKSVGQAAEVNFWKAVEFYHSIAHKMSDENGTAVYVLTSESFNIMPLTMPGKSKRDVENLLNPFMTRLSQLNITYDVEIQESSGYLAHHDAMFDPILVGIAQYGGRLIPQSLIKNKVALFTKAVREIVMDGSIYIGVSLNVSSSSIMRNAYNAVLPAWRNAGISAVVTSPWNESSTWEERLALQTKMTDKWLPKLTALTPDSGCYINEGDFRQPDWKRTFFGVNYDQLLAVKRRYDPNSTFYAHMAVGSDFWKVEADGRLCKA